MTNNNEKISVCCSAEKLITEHEGVRGESIYRCSKCFKPFIAQEEKKETQAEINKFNGSWDGDVVSSPTQSVEEECNCGSNMFHYKSVHTKSVSPTQDWEDEYTARFIFPAEQSYKSAVSDQVAPYRHALENLLEVKDFISKTISLHEQKILSYKGKRSREDYMRGYNEAEQRVREEEREKILKKLLSINFLDNTIERYREFRDFLQSNGEEK